MTALSLQARAARLVEREVLACMSSLVSTLAMGLHAVSRKTAMGENLSDLTARAQELAAPVLDYESAAREAGWEPDPEYPETWIISKAGETLRLKGDAHAADGWISACQTDCIEPHELEVYEHWAVSQWLAEKLIEQGERVDTDFAGLNVWARTTTGQSISADDVIERIVETTGYASAA